LRCLQGRLVRPPKSKVRHGCGAAQDLSRVVPAFSHLEKLLPSLGRVTLFPDRHFAPQLVEEIHQEYDVVLRLLRPLGLGGRHQRHDALAVGREIDVPRAEVAPDLLIGPQPRSVGHEGIALHRIRRCQRSTSSRTSGRSTGWFARHSAHIETAATTVITPATAHASQASRDREGVGISAVAVSSSGPLSTIRASAWTVAAS